MTFRNSSPLVFLCLVLLGSAAAQEGNRVLTNADIANMAKSGIGEQTIVIMIQRAVANFDTSPDAIIELKKAGISDSILNAMLTASTTAVTTSESHQEDCTNLLDGVLASVGLRETVMAVHSTRWRGQQIITTTSGRSSYVDERVTVFPANVYFSRQQSTGPDTKFVITPEFNYRISGKMTTSVPPTTIQDMELAIKLEPLYIVQHRDEYGCTTDGAEQIGDRNTTRVKVKGKDAEGIWNIDPLAHRLLRTTYRASVSSDQSTTDLSDWRQVQGIYVSFFRRNVKGGVTADLTISEYEVNPQVDVSLFRAPAEQPAAALTFKVLQSKSVPYVVETNGGISTTCNISGSTSTSMSSSTLGNNTYGTATSTPNLQMNCRSSDNTVRWTHVLNAMFVEASDGNAYIISCDRAWRWSKCVPLNAGDTFLARRTDKGFLVQFNRKSKEQEATYGILQSKSIP